MRNGMCCFRCFYFEKMTRVEDKSDYDKGRCNRYPPRVQIDGTYKFPIVEHSDWCGEFLDDTTGKRYLPPI